MSQTNASNKSKPTAFLIISDIEKHIENSVPQDNGIPTKRSKQLNTPAILKTQQIKGCDSQLQATKLIKKSIRIQ